MDRAAATAYLTAEFAALWTETGLTPDDLLLDRAFRAVGVAESALPTATVADSAVPKLLAALDYYALLRLSRALAGAVDVSKSAAGASVSKARGQLARNVKDLLAEATAQFKARGLAPASAGTVPTTRWGGTASEYTPGGRAWEP